MNAVTQYSLRDLVVPNRGQHVSIYMSTHPAHGDGDQDVRCLRNLVGEAEKRLIDRGMGLDAARRLVQPILAVPQQLDWSRRRGGLAIYCSDGFLKHFHTSTAFDQTLKIADRFHVKQLLQSIADPFEFFVLAVSRNHVRMLRCTSTGFTTISSPQLPRGMKETLNLQGADRGEQVHSGMRGDYGKRSAVFHGQGGHRDTIKEETAEYFRIINNALRPALRKSTCPLILAGVRYELALLKKAIDYAHIVEKQLLGSFDRVSDRRLYEQALPIAEKYAHRTRHEAITKYNRLTDTIKGTDEPDEIVPAAYEGRVEMLLVDHRCKLLGSYDVDNKSLDLDVDCKCKLDLVEEVIAQTVIHDGKVYPVVDELRFGKPLRALIRYY